MKKGPRYGYKHDSRTEFHLPEPQVLINDDKGDYLITHYTIPGGQIPKNNERLSEVKTALLVWILQFLILSFLCCTYSDFLGNI